MLGFTLFRSKLILLKGFKGTVSIFSILDVGSLFSVFYVVSATASGIV